MKRAIALLALVCLFAMLSVSASAQTNPAAQSLPFSLTAQTGSTPPAGVALHRFGTTSGIPTTRTLLPGTGDLPYNSTSNAGGWRDEGANGISLLASGSQAAGALVVAINTTGLTNVQVSWTTRTILQQASRDNSIALQYRLGTSGNFIDIDPTVYSSTGKSAGDAATFTNVALPAAAENQPVVQVRWLYWESASTSGSRDRLAVDDISIASSGAPAAPTVTTSVSSLADFGSVGVGGASAPKSYTVSGSGLTSGITVTAPADFQVSTASNSGFTSSLTIAQSGGTAPTTTVFVRFAPSSTGVKGGNVTNESAGATTKNVAVSGTAVNGYTISGTVRNAAGSPMGGVSLTLASGETPVASTVTDASGNYSFPGVAGGGDYTVTPSAAGFTFTPASRSFDALGANQTADFTAVSRIIISEFRFRGPGASVVVASKQLSKSSPAASRLSVKQTVSATAAADPGSDDEFVELYNQTDQPVNLSGWSLVSAGGTVLKTIPAGTIPARGHYLLAGAGYSLGSAAGADATLGVDIPDGSGVALYNNSSTLTTGTRLDAAGFSGADAGYVEGGGLSPAGGVTAGGEYSFVRRMTSGAPQDTDDNAADFVFVSTDGGTYNGVDSTLGAPGPENTASPLNHTSDVKSSLLAPCQSPALDPNRSRDTGSYDDTLSGTGTYTSGTIRIRRVFTNNTGASVTRLRFRVVDITTKPAPAGTADLRAVSAGDETGLTNPCGPTSTKGLTLELPPTQPIGGGLNSSLAAGTITLNEPLAPSASINVGFLLGVRQTGSFRFFVTVDAGVLAPTSNSEHLTMGNPSNATPDTNQPTNYLMVKTDYALAYHRDRGTPIWTSWHLDSSWLGSAPRQNDFRADTTLPPGWYQVQGTDYSGSGYDRGHMTPSADRTASIPINSETFLMTNMIPQLPANNQGPWADLETYCRTLVGQGNEVYIISGGSGTQGTIANGHVTIPTQTWKVIIVLPVGTDDVNRVTTSTRTIAVIMPNSGAINADWRTYRVSVDQVEALTGFDFFSNVPVNIQAVIESTVDNQ